MFRHNFSGNELGENSDSYIKESGISLLLWFLVITNIYCFVLYCVVMTFLLRHQPSAQAAVKKITMCPLWGIIKDQGSRSHVGLLCFTGASMIGGMGSHSSGSSGTYASSVPEAEIQGRLKIGSNDRQQ